MRVVMDDFTLSLFSHIKGVLKMSIGNLKEANVLELAVGTDDADNEFSSSTIVANPDGSVLERLEALQQAVPRIVGRATDTLPQGTQEAIYTVSGRVLIKQIVGEVTTQIQAQANDMKLIANPTVGADVDLCAAVESNGDVVGTLYNITGTLANAMVATTSGAVIAQAVAILVAAGTIDFDCAASSSGNVKWTLHYVPLDAGSTIVATAV